MNVTIGLEFNLSDRGGASSVPDLQVGEAVNATRRSGENPEGLASAGVEPIMTTGGRNRLQVRGHCASDGGFAHRFVIFGEHQSSTAVNYIATYLYRVPVRWRRAVIVKSIGWHLSFENLAHGG